MRITICIGSSCHLKGSRQIVEKLQELVAINDLKDFVELCGVFCMGKCTKGVSVTVDDRYFSLSADIVDDFFENEVLPNFCSITKK